MATMVSQRAAGERVARGQDAHSAQRRTTTDSRDAAPLVEATPDDASTAAVKLDPAGVARLRSRLGSTGARSRLVELLGTRTPELLADMRSTIEAGDAGALTREAHKLKGHCTTLTATHILELCRELEVSAGAGSLRGATALVDQIEGAFEEAHAALCDCVSSKVRDRMTTDVPSRVTTDDRLNQRGPRVAARRIT
jgi:HPt (histidine-containing phosphotransfer) domain-containing protein